MVVGTIGRDFALLWGVAEFLMWDLIAEHAI
jgi:hypothetical protein